MTLKPSLKFRSELMRRGLTVSGWARSKGHNVSTVWTVLRRLDGGRRFRVGFMSRDIAAEILMEMGEEK
jgi:gp16 family phage-associated protein